MKQTTILGMLTFVAILTPVAWHLAASEGASPSTMAAGAGDRRHPGDIELPRDAELISARVPASTTLVSVLESHEVPSREIVAIVSSARDEFDLRRFRSGQPYRLDQWLDGRVRGFEYEIDGDRLLTVVRREQADEPGFEAAISQIPKTFETATVEGVIDRETPSLVQALEASGERIDLGLAMADVFAGEIDFNNDLQPGDGFRLVVERATREDGAFAGYGPVLAAEFVNAGRRLRAIRYTSPDGQAAYFDEQGRSLKRMFLKSPLKFEPRITSSYSRARRHPILKVTRAHRGVDYAAPAGAPVVSVSGGVVAFAGWTAGGGRTVKVRHASGYQSEYLHLSAITVRPGARVGQGDIVGKVGATGLATGVHLHYGLKKNGAYVNPVTEHRNMPPGEPVPAGLLNAFQLERDRLFGVLFADPGIRAADN